MIKNITSMMLVLLVAACATTGAGDDLHHYSADELDRMSFDQRLDYLAESYKYLAAHPNAPHLGTLVASPAIYPTYMMMLRHDGAYKAAVVYALTQIREGQQIDRNRFFGLLPTALAAGQRDPELMAAISARNFPPDALSILFSKGESDEMLHIDESLLRDLAKLASKGDPKACEILSGLKATDVYAARFHVNEACASASGAAQGAFQKKVQSQQLLQQAVALGNQRAQKLKQQQIAAAQELVRYCQSVGVSDQVLQDATIPGKIFKLQNDWRYAKTSTELSQGNLDAYVQDYAHAARKREEAVLVDQGTAITPTLTPLMFQIVVKPVCGLPVRLGSYGD